MIATAWNNGYHYTDDNGYGIKLTARDRDIYFNKGRKTILLELDGEIFLLINEV